jgi:hypothetical protein
MTIISTPLVVPTTTARATATPPKPWKPTAPAPPPNGPTTTKGNIAFDFDGVLHEHGKMRWPAGRLDFAPLREAMKRGYAVTIMTANIPASVGRELEKHGFKVYVDSKMSYSRWASKGVILVTNRKVSAVAYVDDRAIHWTFGSDPAAIWDAAELVKPSPVKPRTWVHCIRRIRRARHAG